MLRCKPLLLCVVANVWACAGDDPDIHGPSLRTGQSVVPAGAAGSGGGDEPDPGADGSGTSADPSFEAAYSVLDDLCVSAPCHGDAAAGQLDMSSRTLAHDNLVSIDAAEGPCADSGLLRVDPGDPDASLLIAKLDDDPPCGVRMPIGGVVASDELATLRAWISAGAPPD